MRDFSQELRGLVKLPLEMENSQISKQIERFKAAFDRLPSNKEPLFYSDRNFAFPMAMSTYDIEQFKESIVAELRATQVAEDMIYAFRKTGYLFVEFKPGEFNETELVSWNSAIKEFQTLTSDQRIRFEKSRRPKKVQIVWQRTPRNNKE